VTRLLVAFALLASTVALADLTLVNEATSNGKNRTVTFSVRGNKAFFEMVEDGGLTRTMLRDVEAKKSWIVDHDKKVLLLMTEEDSKALEARQEAFRAQMRAQLEKLPPEQRARMEQTMLGGADPSKAPQFTYEKKNTPARKVAGFSCEEYLIKRDGVLHGEGCFAQWKATGMSSEEFKATMLKAMPSSAASGPMLHAFEAHNNAPGMPVERSTFDAQGNVLTRTSLKSMSKKALPAEKFELPKGYTEKSMMPAAPPAPAPAPAPVPGK
jgi:hypothetical protein